MSNQIVISSGAKVRSLEGVLTGTAGIVNSVPLGGANGVATLDSSGKVPLSQLPASVITYLGTWNAATNTPTLTNGVGDVGDLYICNVAGTVNFGAGPITFAVGDWVIYSGTTWEKSGGASGTVTSVAMTVPTGLSVTGSPITTSGTLAVDLASGYTIPTTSFLSGLVPYTGATQTVDLGSYDLNARGIKINGTGGSGHADFKHQSGTPTGSASSSTLYADTNGDMAWKNDHSYITTLIGSGNTANRNYTLPNASGTLALTSDLSGYVTIGTTQTITGLKTFTTAVKIDGGSTGQWLGIKQVIGSTNTGTSGYTSIYALNNDALGISFGTANDIWLKTASPTFPRTYTFPNADGTIALTSDIPSLTGYVPYTGATNSLYMGSSYLVSAKSFITSGTSGNGYLKLLNSLVAATPEADGVKLSSVGSVDLVISSNTYNSTLVTSGNTANRTYTFPNASGTIALTSDIPSLTNYVTLNGNQTITGIKTFTNEQLFGNGLTMTGGYITYTSGSYNLTLNTNILTANRNVFLQDKAGTIALTSDIPSLSGYVQGSGTTNNLSKFTASGTIGNSTITDDGSIVSILNSAYSNVLRVGSSSNSLYFTPDGGGTSLASAGGGFTGQGVYMASGAGQVELFTNSTSRLFIANGGNVGIGNTSPSYKLDVTGTGRFTTSLGVGAAGAYASTTLLVRANSATSTNWGFIVEDNASNQLFGVRNNGNVGIGTGSPSSLLELNSSSPKITLTASAYSGSYRTILGTRSGAEGVLQLGNNNENFIVAGNSGTGGYFSFYVNATSDFVSSTNGTLAMRITSGGVVLIGGTTVNPISGAGSLQVYKEIVSLGSSAFLGFANRASTNTFGWYGNTNAILYNDGVGNIASINASTGIYTPLSDINKKKDFEDSTIGLNEILALKPTLFRMKSEDDNIPKTLGFIAQEVKEFIPQAYVESGEGEDKFIGLSDRPIIAALVKAIQELEARLKTLENK